VLRHLIQHYSAWLVLLFAGLRTLEEMGRDWYSYFISVRPLHVSYLDQEAARKLILLPATRYPIHYEERAVEAILRATRAQPFLVQVVGFELIQHLNSQSRRLARPSGQVTLDDVRQAIGLAVVSAYPYFAYLWEKSSDPERLILANLAYGQSKWTQVGDLGADVDMTLPAFYEAIGHLERRELIEKGGRGYCFQVPMMRQWIRNEKSLEAVRVASQSPSDAARGRGQE
jgi:hypothetical protein